MAQQMKVARQAMQQPGPGSYASPAPQPPVHQPAAHQSTAPQPTAHQPLNRPTTNSAPAAPVPPTQQEASIAPRPEATTPGALPRDILLAKARAFKEQSALQSRQGSSEQLSMDVNENKAKDGNISVPLNQNDLDVPTYLRRKQVHTQDDA